jgi:NADH-quinone oxidoreductase subunit M
VELATLLPLLALSLLLGLFPKPLLERVEPSVKALIAHVEERSDYEPPKVAELGPDGVAEPSSKGEGGHD